MQESQPIFLAPTTSFPPTLQSSQQIFTLPHQPPSSQTPLGILFHETTLTRVQPLFLNSTQSHPRPHTCWLLMLYLLLPGFSAPSPPLPGSFLPSPPDEFEGGKFAAFWRVLVEPLLASSTPRRCVWVGGNGATA